MKAATGLPVKVDNDANGGHGGTMARVHRRFENLEISSKSWLSRDLVLELFLMDSSITVKPVRRVSSGT